MRELNITNGDGAADILKQSVVSGDVLPWRDPMHHGPCPAELSLAEFSIIRARYLAGAKANTKAAEEEFRARDDRLRALDQDDRIILWFEHDLLDQLQLLQILDWFSTHDPKVASLDLICIDRFPDMPDFRGLGQLSATQMASLLDQRRPVTEEMLRLAAGGWAAFRADDPNALLGFLSEDLNALPFLSPALQRHLEEFPDATTGLTRTEVQLLRLISDGVHHPQLLFRRNMDLETALFIGDWPTYRAISGLCKGGLVACAPSQFRFPLPKFDEQHLSLTELGQHIMEGRQTAFGHMRRDGWLGGVNLKTAGATWVWNKHAAQFLQLR